MRVFGVIGWKNSGKTHLMVRLISEITARGFSVSSVKHAHHSLELNSADDGGNEQLLPEVEETIISSQDRWSHVRQSSDPIDYPLADLLGRLQPVDLVLVEGFKLEDHPKLEAFRSATGRELLARRDKSIIAVATDNDLGSLDQTVFDLDNTKGIADFILTHVGLRSPQTEEH